MEQLYKKINGQYIKVYPLNYIENILDSESGNTLASILSNFNNISLPYQDNAQDTRALVPQLLRRKGLWITYNNGEDYITEYYKGGANDIQEYWAEDYNWEIVPNLKYVQDNAGKLPNGIITADKLSPALLQLIQSSGKVVNMADDEDIEEVNSTLKFKDRKYNPELASGKGYKILRKNWTKVGGRMINLLTQDMINEANTVYEIRYDFDLNEKEITIPEGCSFYFNGGKLINGNIIASLKNNILDITDFGAKEGEDIAPILNMLLNLCKSKDGDSRPTQNIFTIIIPSGIWKCSALEIVNRSGFHIKGVASSFSHNDISRRGTIIVPYNTEQTYIWKLGKNEAHTGQCLNWSISDITFSDYDRIAHLTDGALYLYYASFGFLRDISIKDFKGTAINFVNTWEIDTNFLNIRDADGYEPKVLFSPVSITGIYANHTQLYFNCITFENCDGRFIETKNGCYLSHSIIGDLIVEWYPKNRNAEISSYEEYLQAEEYALIRLSADVNLIINNITIDKSYNYFTKDGKIYKLNTIFETDSDTMFSPCQLSVNNIHIQGDRNNSQGNNGIIFDSTHLAYIVPFKGFSNSSINCNGIIIHSSDNNSYPKTKVLFKLKNTAIFNINSIIDRTHFGINASHFFNSEFNPVVYANSEERIGYRNGTINYEENNPYNYGLYVNLKYHLNIPFRQNKRLFVFFKGDIGNDYQIYLGKYNGGDYFSKSNIVTADGTVQCLSLNMPNLWDFPYIPLNIIGSDKSETIKIYKIDFGFISGEPSLYKNRKASNGDIGICRGKIAIFNAEQNKWLDYSNSDISLADRGNTDNRPSGEGLLNGFMYWNTDHGDYDIWNGHKWISGSGLRYNADNLNFFDLLPSNNRKGLPIFYNVQNRPLWCIEDDKFVDGNGIRYDAAKQGTFAQRPTEDYEIPIGFAYFCTDKQTPEGATNGIMIYYKGDDVWVDALGRVV